MTKTVADGLTGDGIQVKGLFGGKVLSGARIHLQSKPKSVRLLHRLNQVGEGGDQLIAAKTGWFLPSNIPAYVFDHVI